MNFTASAVMGSAASSAGASSAVASSAAASSVAAGAASDESSCHACAGALNNSANSSAMPLSGMKLFIFFTLSSDLHGIALRNSF